MMRDYTCIFCLEYCKEISPDCRLIFLCFVSDPESDFEDITSLVLDELGENMHIALHSRENELQYQRQLVESLLPSLLPSSALGSRYVCGHMLMI